MQWRLLRPVWRYPWHRATWVTRLADHVIFRSGFSLGGVVVCTVSSACFHIKSMWNLKIWASESSETPYSVTFSYMIATRRSIPVVILLVFIILKPINSCSHARALDISSFSKSTMYLSSDATQRETFKEKSYAWRTQNHRQTHRPWREKLDAATVDVTSNLDEYKQAPNASKLRQQRESLRTLHAFEILKSETVPQVNSLFHHLFS